MLHLPALPKVLAEVSLFENVRPTDDFSSNFL